VIDKRTVGEARGCPGQLDQGSASCYHLSPQTGRDCWKAASSLRFACWGFANFDSRAPPKTAEEHLAVITQEVRELRASNVRIAEQAVITNALLKAHTEAMVRLANHFAPVPVPAPASPMEEEEVEESGAEPEEEEEGEEDESSYASE
jgi:hypothetical protein